ncbi:MAG: DUF2794 domain-containing protein [Ruegeria sp.]
MLPAFPSGELPFTPPSFARRVVLGEWGNYAFPSLADPPVSPISPRPADNPIYRVKNPPRLRQRQGMYSVVGMDGRILKRGQDLRTVLRVLERKLIRAVDPN